MAQTRPETGGNCPDRLLQIRRRSFQRADGYEGPDKVEFVGCSLSRFDAETSPAICRQAISLSKVAFQISSIGNLPLGLNIVLPYLNRVKRQKRQTTKNCCNYSICCTSASPETFGDRHSLPKKIQTRALGGLCKSKPETTNS